MIQIRSGQILSGESPSLRFAIYGFLPYTIFIIVFDGTNEIHDTTESRLPTRIYAKPEALLVLCSYNTGTQTDMWRL